MSLIPQNICRICEQEQSTRQLINISTPQYELLLNKYLAFADVTFDINDDLPKYFCKTCVKILNTAYDFKIQCELAHKKFLKLSESMPIVGEYYISASDTVDTKLIDLDIVEIKIEPQPIDEICEYSPLKLELNVQLQPTTETEKQYECYMCRTTFLSKSNLGRHMSTQHDNTKKKIQPERKKCILCDKTFADQSSLGRHTKRIHFGQKIKEYVKKTPCEICGRTFASAAIKKRHFNIVHKAERLFACELCGNSFGQLTGLQHHVACVHSDERNYKCDKCSSDFKTKGGLDNHQFVHLPKEERIHWRRPNNYLYNREHQKVYNSKRKICEICGRMIIASGMEGHMRIHDGLKPYECTVCQKCFSTKQKLKRHSDVHTDERRYKCDLCLKTFRQRANLRAHLIRHSGTKSYQCSFCDKAFALPFNLRVHERTHTGEKPYNCNLCADKFSNSGALRRHATNVHPGEEAVAVTLKPKQYVAERWL